MIRVFLAAFGVFVICTLSICGLRGRHFVRPPLQVFPDMKHQPKLIAQHPSNVFSDGRGDRPPVEGSVPLGYNLANRYSQTQVANISGVSGFSGSQDYHDTGVVDGFYGTGVPGGISLPLLRRGQERYSIYCAICHGESGNGDGPAKSFGLSTVASLNDGRVREQPDGMLFETITNGRNTMGAYGPVISVQDRWAIVAYVRALQSSEGVPLNELGSQIKKKFGR